MLGLECFLFHRRKNLNFNNLFQVFSDCVDCKSVQSPTKTRFSMPLTTLGVKKYYIGIFFKVLIRLLVRLIIHFLVILIRLTGRNLLSTVATMECISPVLIVRRSRSRFRIIFRAWVSLRIIFEKIMLKF